MPRISYPFAAVPNQIARGGHGVFNLAVLVVLLSHGRTTASLDTLAKEVGCSRKKVQAALKYWIEDGKNHGIEILSTKENGRPAIYEVIIHSMTDTQVENDLGVRSKTSYLPRSKTTYKEEPLKKNPEEESPPTPQNKNFGDNRGEPDSSRLYSKPMSMKDILANHHAKKHATKSISKT